MPFNIPDETEATTYPAQAGLYGTDFDILVAAQSETSVIMRTAGDTTGYAVSATTGMVLSIAAGQMQAAGVALEPTLAAQTVTIGAAHASLYRFDLVSLSAAGVPTVTAGTAAAQTAPPIPPALPSGHVGLAFVWVPPTVTTITSGMLVDKRVVKPGSGRFFTDATIDGLYDFRRAGGAELKQWRAALGNRYNAPANIYIVGDSHAEGYGATSFARRWMDIFRDGIQREYRTGGVGFIPSKQGVAQTWPAPLTQAGTPNQTDFGWGLGRRTLWLDSTDDIVTGSFVGDRLFVLYTKLQIGGTMKITIDGVVSTLSTIDANRGISGRVWDSGQLTLGTHTFRIEPNAASNNVFFEGIAVFNTDALSGVHVWDSSHSGFHAAHFNGDTTEDAGVGVPGVRKWWADAMFQPYTTNDGFSVTANGTTTLVFGGAPAFTSDDVGEVIYGDTSNVNHPKGCRIVSVTNSTTVVVNKTVVAGTYTLGFTRARVTDAVRVSGTQTITSATAAFNPWDVGKTVSGTGIITGSVIKAVNSATSITISLAATSSGSGGTLQIKNRQRWPMRPHLLILEFGNNEMIQSATKATYKANLQAVVTTMLEQGQIDLPTMTGIYTDETPSIALMGLWSAGVATDVFIPIATVNGSPLISSSSGSAVRFTQADVGKTISIAGNNPIPAGTTILSVQGPDNATMSANANATNAAALPTLVNRSLQDEQWQDFRYAMAELANERTWRFLDLYTLGGYIGSDLYQLTVDGIHANDRGQQWIADELATAIGGQKRQASIPQGIFDRKGEMIVASDVDTATKVPGILITTADIVSGTTANVMVDISNLAFYIGPGETLAMMFALMWTSAAATSGIVFDLNPAAGVSAPAALTMSTWGLTGAAAGASVGRLDAAWGTDLIITGGSGSATVPNQTFITVGVTAGAVGGLITPRFAPEAAAATTLRRGTFALIL